jgi:hypothetical protein
LTGADYAEFEILDLCIELLFRFAANITIVSEEPAGRNFKLPYGTKQHVFVF